MTVHGNSRSAPLSMAYADPPYFKQGTRLYGDHPEAAIWDTEDAHRELAERLVSDYPDGWALSCNPAHLPMYLGFLEDVRLAAWVKSYHQIRVNVAVQYAWEPLIFSGGRSILRRKPLVRDWLMCSAGLSDPSLIGSKPPAFCRWVLDILGFDPDQGDTIDDLFPGSGVMGRTVRDWTRQEALLA